jgi:hypothetical protein
MSYDKITVNYSTLDAVKEVLGELNFPFTLRTMQTVQGRGCNDELVGDNDERVMRQYDLCRLQYGDFVILEKIIQTKGCDDYDVIHSYKFRVNQEPKDWNCVDIQDFDIPF